MIFIFLLLFPLSKEKSCLRGKGFPKLNSTLTKGQNYIINPLSDNPTKWSNTLKQFVGKFPTNCLSVFGHCVILVLKWLKLKLAYKCR